MRRSVLERSKQDRKGLVPNISCLVNNNRRCTGLLCNHVQYNLSDPTSSCRQQSRSAKPKATPLFPCLHIDAPSHRHIDHVAAGSFLQPLQSYREAESGVEILFDNEAARPASGRVRGSHGARKQCWLV